MTQEDMINQIERLEFDAANTTDEKELASIKSEIQHFITAINCGNFEEEEDEWGF